MTDTESDDYLRGVDRGIEAAVAALGDVLSRGKQGNFQNAELEKFATLLSTLRPAIHKVADPAVRACLVRVRVALVSVEEHVRGIEWALATDADLPAGSMELLGIVVANVERALDNLERGR